MRKETCSRGGVAILSPSLFCNRSAALTRLDPAVRRRTKSISIRRHFLCPGFLFPPLPQKVSGSPSYSLALNPDLHVTQPLRPHGKPDSLDYFLPFSFFPSFFSPRREWVWVRPPGGFPVGRNVWALVRVFSYAPLFFFSLCLRDKAAFSSTVSNQWATFMTRRSRNQEHSSSPPPLPFLLEKCYNESVLSPAGGSKRTER